MQSIKMNIGRIFEICCKKGLNPLEGIPIGRDVSQPQDGCCLDSKVAEQ